MDNRAILKSLLISAVASTLVLAFAAGYSSTTTPDGVTTHHYTFSLFGFWVISLGLFVTPTTFVFGYPLVHLLFKLRVFSIYTVSLSGTIGAIVVVAFLLSKFPPAPMLMFYYGLGGFVASVTAFISYKNLTKRSI